MSNAKLAALRQENKLMRDVLKELEFLEYKGFTESVPRCPLCKMGKGDAHANGCRLAEALATKENTNDPTSA